MRRLADSGAVEALKVLHFSTSNDSGYSAFIEARSPGSTWVSKPTVLTGNDTIGGEFDAPIPGEITVNIPAANAPGGKVFGRLKGRLNP